MFQRIRPFIACLAACAALAAAGACRKGPSTARGDEYFNKHDYRAAILEYRAVIARNERDGVTRQKLARAYRASGAMREAWGEYARAADLLPDDMGAQMDAAEALLQTGQFQDARSRADLVIARDPDNVRAHTVKGLATAGLKDMDGALEEIQRALELDPTHATSYANLGAIQIARGQSDEAEAALKKAVALAPGDVQPQLALATFYWRTNRRDMAEATLEHAVADSPSDPLANRGFALLFIVTGRPEQAEAPLKVYAAGQGVEGDIALADYYIAMNRPQDAVPVLQRASGIANAHAAAEARLAGIQYVQGHRDEAYKRIDALLTQQPQNVQVLVLKARWLLSEGRKDEALAAASAAVAAEPTSVQAQYVLGNVRVARDEAPEAIAAYTEVLRLDPQAVPAQLELARLNTAMGRPSTAVQLASTIVTADPSNLSARLALVQGLRRQKDYEGAERELAPLLKAAPNAAPVQVEAGELALRQKNLAAAASKFDLALKLDPDSYDALAGRVNVALSKHENADAIRRVEARLARHPKDAASLALAGRTYGIAGDLTKSEAALRQAIDADPSYMAAYYYLGQLYVRQHKLEEARLRYEEMTKRQPLNIGAHTMVAMLLQAEGKAAEAKARYEQILRIDSRAIVAANNLAFMNAESGTDLDLALQLARAASAAKPDEPEINDTLGWVYYKRDLAVLATGPLQKSVESVPGNPTYRYHLGMSYVKTGDTAKAREMLQEALKLDPDFPGAADAKNTLRTLAGAAR
jgi:tetratricopeptide (TPR) repeat protein